MAKKNQQQTVISTETITTTAAAAITMIQSEKNIVRNWSVLIDPQKHCLLVQSTWVLMLFLLPKKKKYK